MRKVFFILTAVGLTGLMSCSDTFEPNVDFGERTYVNDYSELVGAVNNMALSFNDKLDVLNNMVHEGLVDIKVSVDNQSFDVKFDGTPSSSNNDELNQTLLSNLNAINTTLASGLDAINSSVSDVNNSLSDINQSSSDMNESLKDLNTTVSEGLAALNTSLLKGLTMLNTTFNEVGDKVIECLNDNGQLIQLQMKEDTDNLCLVILNNGNVCSHSDKFSHLFLSESVWEKSQTDASLKAKIQNSLCEVVADRPDDRCYWQKDWHLKNNNFEADKFLYVVNSAVWSQYPTAQGESRLIISDVIDCNNTSLVSVKNVCEWTEYEVQLDRSNYFTTGSSSSVTLSGYESAWYILGIKVSDAIGLSREIFFATEEMDLRQPSHKVKIYSINNGIFYTNIEVFVYCCQNYSL